MSDIHDQVKDYYGKQLEKSDDLKTNACCTVVSYPKHIKEALAQIHDEVMSKYYGCGLTIPDNLKGTKVLDLGSGSGRDCYLVSKLTGEEGRVVGVDMTDEQLNVANRHIEYHAQKFGHTKSNVTFLKGNIDKLEELDLGQNTFDIIISNCVINLVKDKKKVIQDCYNLLNEGGEMYFSDVYASRRIPQKLVDDPVLYGECLSGALYWNDFEEIAKEVGFKDPRVVESALITVNNPELESKVEGYKFYSITYRLFKHEKLERGQEDYGLKIKYLGTIEESPEKFILDKDYTFEKNTPIPVDGNTARMIKYSRYNSHFAIEGSFCTHLGEFSNNKSNPKLNEQKSGGNSCC